MLTQIMNTGAKITDSYLARRLKGIFDPNGFSQCPPCFGADKFPDNRGPCVRCSWVVPNLHGCPFKCATINEHNQYIHPLTHEVLKQGAGTHHHGEHVNACDDFKKKYFPEYYRTKKSWWSFFTNKPLITVIVVLILVILLMAGVLWPLLEFIGSILMGLATSFLDLFRGMLCPCGSKWDPENWVDAEVAEGYRDTIANLQKENLNLQRELDWAKTQQKQVPDPPFDNTAQTQETTPPSVVDWKGYSQAVINLAALIGSGFWAYYAATSSGVNALAGAPQMSLPGQAAQGRASASFK
jgi:hypothetical protein